MNALSSNSQANFSSIELNNLNQVKDLNKLKVTITLTLTEKIIKGKPSDTFINWLSSNPTLSTQDINIIDNFYEEKSIRLFDMHSNKYFIPRYKNKYNAYIEYILNHSSEIRLLDEYFVDETCVIFLLFINNKIKSPEIMLDGK